MTVFRHRSVYRQALLASVAAVGCLPAATGLAVTANSLAELRSLGATVNNTAVTLSPTGGDPHPVTGVVTPGQYWINGDHFADPTNTEPIFLDLGGTGNTYSLGGTTINLDTRELDGFGRNLGHGSAVRVLRISGSNNLVQGIDLIGQDIALDTDPNAQRYADWSARFVELSGNSNTVDGANVVATGSRTDAYGLGDAFGKGAARGVAPFLSHRKASAFRVGEANDAVVNDLTIDIKSFGHAFFVQNSNDTTLTNSTITGELFSSQGVIDHPLYQEHGVTYHQNEIPEDILISGAEGGVRLYTGSSGLVAENVVVTGTRTGFATSLGGGDIVLNNVEAYGVENAFAVGSNTTITNAKADGVNGPVVVIDRNDRRNSSVEVELVGDQPFNTDYALAYVNGSDIDIRFTSDRPAEDFEDTTLIRAAQFYYDNWRETNGTTTFDVAGYDHVDSVLINDTNAALVLGEQASGNTGRSVGPVITNGRDNAYDGPSLVPSGKRTVLVHTSGLGNNGTAADGSLEANASVVLDGGTLEVQPGLRIEDEKLTITGDGVDGRGALYSVGSNDSNTRFGSSNNSDESTIFLDGDASIGVGVAGNQLLLGRIQGSGDLTKRGAGSLTIGKSSTYDGDLIIEQGHITARPGVVHTNLSVASGASISGIGTNAYNTGGLATVDGVLDLNARTDSSSLSQRVGLLAGSGSVIESNATAGTTGTLRISGETGSADFSGSITGTIALEKSGGATQILSGSLTHTGTTLVEGGSLFINGSHTGGGAYTVVAGGTLGGGGSVGSGVSVASGGTVAVGGDLGDLFVQQLTLTQGASLAVELNAASASHSHLNASAVSLGGDLVLSLSALGGSGFVPDVSQTFTVLDAQVLSGSFDNVASGQRLDTTGGEGSFLVTYSNASDAVTLSNFEVAPSTRQAGDYNGDGFVGQGDLDLVLLNFGSTGPLPLGWDPAAGFDGSPSQNELDAVLLNFGSGAASSFASLTVVPEPAGLALLGFGAAILFRRR